VLLHKPQSVALMRSRPVNFKTSGASIIFSAIFKTNNGTKSQTSSLLTGFSFLLHSRQIPNIFCLFYLQRKLFNNFIELITDISICNYKQKRLKIGAGSYLFFW